MTPPRPPFVLLKFAAAGALVLAACVLGAQAAAHAPAPLAALAAVAIALGGAAAMTAAFWWLLLPLAGVREGMAAAAREVAAREAFAQAQNSLEANMNMLRASIYALGEPRRRGEELRFGHTLINDNFEIVDAVKRAYGGVATVFLGDVRVATNVVAADGKRAVGTRLAAGKVRDRVLGEGKTFRGPADILGVPHLTIYEPILSGGETVGVLFIGIRAAEAAAQDLAAPRDEFADMRRTLALFNASSQARQEADQQADVLRQEADDARRAHEAARQTAARSQQQVVDAMSQGLEQLARSRLDHRLEGPFPAEYAKLKTDFNAALAALADVMSRITDGAGVMGRGVGEIADAVGDLSRRTEQQAATLQQTAAALDQITVTVEKTAEGAVSVRDAAASAKEEAEGSAEVMREAVSAMTEIEQASHRIGAIIGLIDEIALQTSLLALNAGIEASRAGDAGRGFSVVAAEVRVLAQRTTEAARDVKTLISASSTRVAQGKGLVDEGGAALERIRGQVADIHAVTVGIAASAREQSSALAQINGAINQMDHVTRQNAAMAEETTAASQELTSGAEDLLGLVGAFRLAAQTTEAARPSRPMRAAA